MKARLTRDFRAAPTGTVMPRTYKAGEIVDGEVAQWALESKAAVEVKDTAPPPRTPKAPAAQNGAPAGSQDDPPARKG